MKGTYALVIRLSKSEKIRIGRLGTFVFPSGFYVYVGSAFGPGGIEARVSRHLRKNKRKHWHIDYLLDKSEVTSIFFVRKKCEEKLAESLLEHGWMVAPNFGASDTNAPTHLIFFDNDPTDLLLKHLKKFGRAQRLNL